MKAKSILDLYQKYIEIAISTPNREDVAKLKREIENLKNRMDELENMYKSIISKKEKEIQQLKENKKIPSHSENILQENKFEKTEEIVLDDEGKEIGPIWEFIKK